MQHSSVMEQLKNYIGHNTLEGKDIGLDETTPLLEWGIINSLEIVKLLSFIHEQFAVDIPPDKLIPDYFANLSTLADLVLETALV